MSAYVIGTDDKTVISLENIPREMVTPTMLYNALCNVKRFNGRGVSVTRHSYWVWSIAKHLQDLDPALHAEVCLYALLHDAHEAFTGDIIQPMKNKENLAIERCVTDQIWYWYTGSEEGVSTWAKTYVEIADKLAMVYEVENHFGIKPSDVIGNMGQWGVAPGLSVHYPQVRDILNRVQETNELWREYPLVLSKADFEFKKLRGSLKPFTLGGVE